MPKRRRMTNKQSRRDFKRKSIPHKKNRMNTEMMRGGYRL